MPAGELPARALAGLGGSVEVTSAAVRRIFPAPPSGIYIALNMDIFLVRHARAGRRDARKYPDDDLRPLTPGGRKAFSRAARGLLAAGPPPEAVLSSPALRALETAEILAKALGLGRKGVITVPALHHDVPVRGSRGTLASLSKLDLPEAFAVVGHEPNLGRLASLLVSGSIRARLPLAKGGACLVRTAALAPGSGSLSWSMTQDLLMGL